MSEKATIGSNIRAYRERLGYTQQQLAQFLEVDRSLISLYESDEREVSLVQLDKISDLFGVDMADLANADIDSFRTNIAFAFRSEGSHIEDVSGIASFQKIVKNYIRMMQIANAKD